MAAPRRWLVTHTRTVDADTAEDAIERADDGKCGGHWEAEELCDCGAYLTPRHREECQT